MKSRLQSAESRRIFLFQKSYFLIWVLLVVILLSGCSNSEETNEYGQNELMRAIYYKDYPTVKRLVLKNPEIIVQTDNNGENAIHYAAKYGSAEMMDFLLSQGGDKLIDVEENIQSFTPIQLATISRNFEAFQTLIDHPMGSKQLNILDNKGRTLLHLAASSQSDEIMEELLSLQMDPNIQDVEGNTALMLLLYSIDQYESKISEITAFQITKLFMENGADQYILNNNADSVLSIIESSSSGVFTYSSSKSTVLERASFQLKTLIKTRY